MLLLLRKPKKAVRTFRASPDTSSIVYISIYLVS